MKNESASYLTKKRWTNEILCTDKFDEDGNPTGGRTSGIGFEINWQDGPLGWDYEKNTYPEGVKPNGAFTEDITLALIERIKFFQKANNGRFACRENAIILTKLEEVLMWMQCRHDDRVARKVQGEHKE